MKRNNIILSLSLLAAVCTTACNNLDLQPEGVLTTNSPFMSVGEMQNYIDQFYESGLRHQGFGPGGGGGIAGNDVASDNLSASAPNTRLNGQLALSNASKLEAYTQIRNVNYLIANLGHAAEKGSAQYNHLVGEAYYFRAWYYYRLLVDYGPITWLDQPLEAKLEGIDRPRDSRTFVVDKILADLDTAIENLSEQSSSATMRVHRDVARALKSEVALFEATWEKYHRAEQDPFFDPSITDAKIKDYLTQAASAARAIMDRNVWRIHTTGNPLSDYRELFATTNLSSNKEVLWFKRYDGDQVGNNVNRYLNNGGGSIGVTASLVDDYLTLEGKPFVGDAKLNAKKVFGEELKPTLRDPRLSQTVCMPGQKLRPDQPAYVVPPLRGSSFNQNMTGYSLLKHVQIDYTGNLDAEFKGATPGIQVRYADVLLNYAEALAELDGAANAGKIVEALQPLRDRVGMPSVDFDREYNTEADYPFRDLDKYIQATRRERRIEQASEGRRLYDILRWAAADELIVGKRAMGALFIGSNLNGHESYKGQTFVYDQPKNNNLFLSGKPGDPYRYILPINPASGYEAGWQFDVKRDYLLPIRLDMIARTKDKWTQNPGWGS